MLWSFSTNTKPNIGYENHPNWWNSLWKKEKSNGLYVLLISVFPCHLLHKTHPYLEYSDRKLDFSPSSLNTILFSEHTPYKRMFYMKKCFYLKFSKLFKGDQKWGRNKEMFPQKTFYKNRNISFKLLRKLVVTNKIKICSIKEKTVKSYFFYKLFHNITLKNLSLVKLSYLNITPSWPLTKSISN